MKLSEEIEEMAGDYTYISGSWLSICAEEAEALENKIAELEAQTQWININDKQPDDEQNVLVVENGEVFHVVYDADTKIFYDWVEEYMKFKDVKFWMPLPKPPEDE